MPRPRPLAPTHSVIWSPDALADIEAIEADIARDAPKAAARLRLQLVAAGDKLAVHPERGVRIRGRSRKLLVMSPYVIRYVVDPARVVITSVRDDRRRLRG